MLCYAFLGSFQAVMQLNNIGVPTSGQDSNAFKEKVQQMWGLLLFIVRKLSQIIFCFLECKLNKCSLIYDSSKLFPLRF